MRTGGNQTGQTLIGLQKAFAAIAEEGL